MIDTIKIYSNINSYVYGVIKNNSNIKQSYSNATGEIFYEIVNDNLEGNYNSSISLKVGNGSVYNFTNGFYISIERFLS